MPWGRRCRQGIHPFELAKTHCDGRLNVPPDILIVRIPSGKGRRPYIHHIHKRRVEAGRCSQLSEFAGVDIGHTGRDQNPIGAAGLDRLLEFLPALGCANAFDKMDLTHAPLALKPCAETIQIHLFVHAFAAATDRNQDMRKFP